MVFDGAIVWALLGFFPSRSIAKIRASDATLLQVVNLMQVPESIAFDGTHVWVGQGDGTAIKLRISDVATVATYGSSRDIFLYFLYELQSDQLGV